MEIQNFGDYTFYDSLKPFSTDGPYYGEWLVFFSKPHYDYIKQKCYESVEVQLVKRAKHTSWDTVNLTGHGLLAFKMESNDIQIINNQIIAPRHQLLLTWMIQNSLISKTKTGNYTNIRFKVKSDGKGTHNGPDWNGFTLSNFINLKTGTAI